MKQFNPKIMALPIVLISSLILSCGSSKVAAGSTDDQASRITPTSTTSDLAVAYCNQATDTTQSIKATVSAALDSSNKVDMNYIQLKLTNVPSSFSDNTHYFSLWKWYAESNGYTYTNPNPLSFKLVRIDTGVDLTGNIQTLNWSTVSLIASNLGVSTPADFFQKVRFFVTLDDPTGQYDVLTVGLHEVNSGTADTRIDALIPTFAADPRIYNQSHPSVLQRLHPFAQQDYSAWTFNTFVSRANEMCAPLTQY